ncbi:MAG: tetratricopeptide repeat protein [Acidobacteria bacterium]|nr:tetratricopeptide repeat protein [Acidobacteriota bacterium]
MDTSNTWEHQMYKQVFSFLIVLLAAGTLAPTVLAQGGRLMGVVLDREGNPLEGALVVAENPDANPSRLEQLTDSRGRYTMLGLNSGSWTVTVEIEGFHSNTAVLRLRQGDNPPMAFDMARIIHPLVAALGEEVFDGVDPDQLEQDLTDADLAYNNAQWQVAVDTYRSILDRLPMLNSLRMQIGTALRQLEQYEEAIASYELALAGDSNLKADVEAEIARTRMAMGDFDAAGDALAAAAGSDSASREDLYNLGELEFAKGDVDAAAVWYEQAAAADPSWGKPLFKLGLVALNRGDMDAAKAFFAQVVEKDPNSEEGAQARATLDALP